MTDEIFMESSGYCLACDQNTTFVAKDKRLRDYFICKNCRSIPRERALIQVLETLYPKWRDLIIHDSSPNRRGASKKIKAKCKKYIASQYFPNKPSGTIIKGFRCENLEQLSFEDNSIDLHISQDVMEHVLHPAEAFSEIARTLKPGGAHIFAVPIVRKHAPSRIRATTDRTGDIVHLEPPAYHGNPINTKGSLVATDWGFDICQQIFDACGLFTHVFHIDDLSKGIRAELIEILVTLKPR
jgi:SAM-dependent methyltransferase